MKAKGPGQSSLLLLDVIKALEQFKIPYAIIGAFAASFYGVVRGSLDADAIIYLEHHSDVQKLSLEFQKHKMTVEYRQGDRDDPIKAVINVRDNFGNRVDLLTGIRGMSADVFERIEKTEFAGAVINMVSREDFIAMKIFAGSPKDIQDAVGVLTVSSGKIDLNLLKQLTGNYGAGYLQTLDKLLKSC